MTSCWIIEQGQYSDYRVVGIFSTKENAELVLNYYRSGCDDDWDTPIITERQLDPALTELNAGLIQYIVIVRQLNGGNHVEVREGKPSLGDDEMKWSGGQLYNIWATDKDHAVKIAAERDAQK